MNCRKCAGPTSDNNINSGCGIFFSVQRSCNAPIALICVFIGLTGSGLPQGMGDPGQFAGKALYIPETFP